MSPRSLDAQSLRESYSSMSDDELLTLVSVEAPTYEEEAVEVARTELRRRGLEGERLQVRIHELKSRLYDELTSERSPAKAKLPRWMYLVCLIEGVFVTYLLLGRLAEEGRTRALKQALNAIGLGWIVKWLLWMLWSGFGPHS